MYLTYGLAVIRYPSYRESYRQNILTSLDIEPSSDQDELFPQRMRLLDRFGLRMNLSDASTVNLQLDMLSVKNLTIMPMGENQEAWLGASIHPVTHQLLNSVEMKLPDFDGTFFWMDYEQPFYAYQYIKGGKFGPAGSASYKRVWGRTFRLDSLPIPKFLAQDRAINDLSKELSIDSGLVQRVVFGPPGKGFNGLAFHSEKNCWVVARSLASDPYDHPSEFQELNRNSYKKKGKPIEVLKDTDSGFSFISQSVIYEKFIQKMILQIFDFKAAYVDIDLYEKQFSNRSCLRGELRKIE